MLYSANNGECSQWSSCGEAHALWTLGDVKSRDPVIICTRDTNWRTNINGGLCCRRVAVQRTIMREWNWSSKDRYYKWSLCQDGSMAGKITVECWVVLWMFWVESLGKICLSFCLRFYQSVIESIHHSSVFLSIILSFCLTIHPSIIVLSTILNIHPFIHHSVFLTVYCSINHCIHPSIHQPFFLYYMFASFCFY